MTTSFRRLTSPKYTLPDDHKEGIECVTMDMSKAYIKSVMENIQQADQKIAFDKFHIAQSPTNLWVSAKNGCPQKIRKKNAKKGRTTNLWVSAKTRWVSAKTRKFVGVRKNMVSRTSCETGTLLGGIIF